MNRLERVAKRIQEIGKSTYKPPADNLENEQEYKERWISIYIIYFTMFLISLGFSVIVTGVWPYLDKVGNFVNIIVLLCLLHMTLLVRSNCW